MTTAISGSESAFMYIRLVSDKSCTPGFSFDLGKKCTSIGKSDLLDRLLSSGKIRGRMTQKSGVSDRKLEMSQFIAASRCGTC
jgi:hypothetical protein